MVLLHVAFIKRTTYKLERGHDEARRRRRYAALYFYLQVLALHLVRLVVELREDGGEARVGGRAIWFLGRELERAERLVAPDLELRDPRREPACAVRARCVRGACAVRATCGGV